MLWKRMNWRLGWFVVLAWMLAACGGAVDGTPEAVTLATAVSSTTPTPSPLPTATSEPTATATAVPSATPTPTAAPTVTPTAAPTATPNPYAPFTIEALAARPYGGGLLEIVETLEQNDRFTRYLIKYPSDDLEIYGFMNVPTVGFKFPVALVLHGYVPPSSYETVAYTRRYADALAEAGYFVIHPNFRNWPPSDSGDDTFRTGLAIDVLNLIAIIREQSQDPLGVLRRADADDINLWGHSMGGGVALRVATVNNADYVRTAVLYGAMSGDETKNYGRIKEWSDGRRGDFELAAGPELLSAISPIDNLDRLNAAISIHHGDADDVVPPEWSDELCAALQASDHPVECFSYSGAPHTFRPPWDELFIERYINFFNRY